VPPDFEHVEKYPLSAAPVTAPKAVPVVLGINWYRAFDRPVLKNGIYVIGENPQNLGTLRGGHCVCLKPGALVDPLSWWDFYNQGSEGACVGFGSSRAMSLLNRKRYYARWLWDQAKIIDVWPDTNPGDNQGTSVRAAFDILRDRGHLAWKPSFAADTVAARDARLPDLKDGVAANRWATSVDEIHEVLSSPRADNLGMVPVLNSWGRTYPHIVWMPDATLARVLDEYGEATLLTDR
jgi:hypothetical protein